MSLTLLSKVWGGSIAGQIAAKIGITVSGMPIASKSTVLITMPAPLTPAAPTERMMPRKTYSTSLEKVISTP